MLDPRGLYELTGEQPAADDVHAPVLIHVLSGFIDAGAAGRLICEQMLAQLPHRVVALFDIDQLYDYRSRRPTMVFAEDHWEGYEAPQLALHVVRDTDARPFFLLSGPEPDLQWERFVAAVRRLVEHYRIRLTLGLHAIPMAVPHTRPIGLTAHASPRELVRGWEPWVGRVRVPGNVNSLVELRLGEAGHEVAGFAVHVPHYLAQAEYPDAAAALLTAVTAMTQLRLPTGNLLEAGERTRAAVEEQVAAQPDIAAVVRTLEEQYDAFVTQRGRGPLLPHGPDQFPNAEDLGAELERFLADQANRRDQEDG